MVWTSSARLETSGRSPLNLRESLSGMKREDHLRSVWNLSRGQGWVGRVSFPTVLYIDTSSVVDIMRITNAAHLSLGPKM